MLRIIAVGMIFVMVGLGPLAAKERGKRTSQEAKIRQALDQPTRLNFFDASLSAVIQSLEQRHNIPIYFDVRCLEEGLGSDVPVSQNISGVSLRSGLNLMLAELGLTWMIENEVLFITTPRYARKHPRTVAYDVSKIAGDEKSVRMLATVIETEAELELKPSHKQEQRVMAFSNTLIVQTTESGHARVERLLRQLTKIAANRKRSPNAATSSDERH